MKRKLLSLTAALLCAVGMWADTDYTSKVNNAQAGWTGASGTYSNAKAADQTTLYIVERYWGNDDVSGAGVSIFSQTVSELPNGTYMVVFYATANNARCPEANGGIQSDASDLVYVYAGSDKAHKTYVTSRKVDSYTYPDEYVVSGAVVTDGTLELGMYAEKTGTQWQTIQVKALIRIDEAADDNGVDLTKAIINPSIYNTIQTEAPYGWTFYERTAGNENRTAGTGNTCLELWSNSDMKVDVYQQISNLSKGAYKVTANCHDQNGTGKYSVYGYNPANRERATGTINVSGDGAENYADITTDYLLVTDGRINIGLIGSSSASWITGDDFRLTYYGNAVEVYSPSSFTSGSSATTDTWYEFTVASTASYRITSSAATTLYYTQDSSDDADATASVEIAASGSTNLTLTSGKLYFKSSVNSTIEIEVIADKADYDALDAAISSTETNTLGFEDGEYAPYNNVDALEALAAAKAINQETTNTKTSVQTATTNLTDATWTANDGDVDAIYNGTFAETGTGNNPKGWTRSNNGWGQQITGLTAAANGVASGTTTAWYYNNNGAWQYGNDGVYTMPLAENQTYELSFKYRKHDTDWQSWMEASVLNSDDEGLEVAQFPGAENGTTFVTAKAYFTTGAAGNYILSIEQYGNAHLTDVSLVKTTSATLELSDADGYTPTDRTYYETVDLTRTIKADTWSTFCVPFNMENSELDASAEVKELTDATLNGDNYTLTFSDASSIVAGKPYMVRVPSKIESISVSGKTISSTITPTTEGDVTFTGVYTNDDAPMGSFIISNNAFFFVNSEVTLKAFRGYITVGSGSSVKALNYVFDDDADGISTIENGQLTIDNAPIYNLAGQRIQKMQKGINIVNGRKVLY